MGSLTENNHINKKYCLFSFAAGIAIFLLAALPYAAGNGWIFYFYGDFDAQQTPFLLYLRQYLSELTIPQYDFKAGLGLDFLDAYTFYNLFSPFTLITALIPQ